MLHSRCFLLAAGLLLSMHAGFAQRMPNALPPQPQAQPRVYTYVEQMPAFPGGQDALNEYLQNNSRSGVRMQRTAPKQAARVFVRFHIEPDGQLTHVEILKGLNAAADAEALRLVQSMPYWVPGRQNGHPVTVEHILPLSLGASSK